MSGSNPIIRFFGFIWRFIERLVKGIQVLIFLVVVGLVLSALSESTLPLNTLRALRCACVILIALRSTWLPRLAHAAARWS